MGAKEDGDVVGVTLDGWFVKYKFVKYKFCEIYVWSVCVVKNGMDLALICSLVLI